MADTTDKALDALVARYRQVAGTMRKMKAASIEAHEIDRGADAITALRAERDQWASMVGHIVACLPLKDIVTASATMGELIGAIKDGLAERDALRAQLATPSAPSPEAVARAALEWAAACLPHGVQAKTLREGVGKLAMLDEARASIRALASDPATLAAIVAKAGGGE